MQRLYLSWKRITFLGSKDIPSSEKSTGQGMEGSKGWHIQKTLSRVQESVGLGVVSGKR